MRFLIASLLACALLAAPAAAAECPEGARCGSIDVPVDRAGSVPGTFPIAYATLPATGPRAGTIFFLAGGPGESAVVFTSLIKDALKPVRAAYDIVLVDQRGTGRSGEIDCLELDEGEELVAGCAKLVGDRRAFLTTKETARDLDDLRAFLGLDRIIPLGISYGTKVAGEYARRFPDRTAAVVLDSPVGVGPMDLLFLEGIRALPRVLREACASGPCARTVKDPAAALYAGVKRVQARTLSTPVKVTTRPVRIGEGYVLNALLDADGDPYARADQPAALASLARGDGAPLAHLERRRNEILLAASYGFDPTTEDDVGFSLSRYLATSCLESGLPWAPTSEPPSRHAAMRAWFRDHANAMAAPFRPIAAWRLSVFELCLDWPATPAPEPVADAGPDVPVLVLSGRADLRTPLELATRVAATYPRATFFDVPQVGHAVLTSDGTGCAVRALQAFLGGAAPARCSARGAFPAGRYLPASARGLSARAVARHTVDGLLHDLDASRRASVEVPVYRLHGLRGGMGTLMERPIDLDEVEWFKGMRVSGTVNLRGKGRVTVRGPKGPARTVRL